MTDRIYAYIVTLDKDMRTDDVEGITNAIKMIKHVINVTPLVSTPELHTAEMRARLDIWKAITDAVWGKE